MFTLEKSVAPSGFERILEEAATTFDSSESGRWNPFAHVYRRSLCLGLSVPNVF
jgi:hypothetical protein